MNTKHPATAEGYSYNIESFYLGSRDTGAELNKFRILEQLRKQLDLTDDLGEQSGLRIAIEIVRSN